MTHADVIVVGGGASGMMAAAAAASRGRRVILLEKGRTLGKKLAITGGGRCNIANAEDDEHVLLKNYGEAAPFLYSTFSQFGLKEAVEYFDSRGLSLKTEARKRMFPVSEKAADVVALLAEELARTGVSVRLDTPVQNIEAKEGRITALVADGERFTADSYILSTGGFSHPETGSTGDGFGWLKTLGHTVVPPSPSIVPLTVREKWLKKLAGITIPDARIRFVVAAKSRLVRTGSILLTHFGLSGPTILNAAADVNDLLQEGEVQASIDCLPTLDHGALDSRLVALFDANKNKLVRNALPELVPSSLGTALLEQLGIEPETKVHSVTKDERKALVQLLKAVPLTITGLMGFDRAVIADGGIPLTQIDMRTMRSTVVANLFVTGDLLHVRRPSGGYSLQLCWSTAAVAGAHA